jgi:hypothetical protein
VSGLVPTDVLERAAADTAAAADPGR